VLEDRVLLQVQVVAGDDPDQLLYLDHPSQQLVEEAVAVKAHIKVTQVVQVEVT
jgi:hypothetical protein|tara:strand:- start:437 stop:598 length:162 start_codon:yes stop_codon:yes gene_type:complete